VPELELAQLLRNGQHDATSVVSAWKYVRADGAGEKPDPARRFGGVAERHKCITRHLPGRIAAVVDITGWRSGPVRDEISGDGGRLHFGQHVECSCCELLPVQPSSINISRSFTMSAPITGRAKAKV
jgi:hypothetical protein